MRRWGFLFVLTMAALGGSAEAGPESSAASTAIIQNIESFIAAQRQADGRVCSDKGHAAGGATHRDCIRDLAARRRAEAEGTTPAARAGLDI